MKPVTHVKRRVQVKQAINYFPQGQDHFSYQAEADHYTLTSFEKLVFKDFNQVDLQLKWWPPGHDMFGRLELSQASGSLVFDLRQRTHNAYHSPQGIWDLEIETDKLEIGQEIIIHYRLFLANQCLGSYDFQLIFKD